MNSTWLKRLSAASGVLYVVLSFLKNGGSNLLTIVWLLVTSIVLIVRVGKPALPIQAATRQSTKMQPLGVQ